MPQPARDRTNATSTGSAAGTGRRSGRHSRHSSADIVLDALAGAAAGVAAVWVMDRIDWFNFRRGLDNRRTRQQTQQARPGGMDPAQVLAAETADQAGLVLTRRQRDTAGLIVHYGLGMVPGALYGALRGRVAYLDAGRGSLFGLGMFLIKDEGMNAALGLSGRPQDYPWTAHARGLVAHLAYGLVTDALCRIVSEPSGIRDARLPAGRGFASGQPKAKPSLVRYRDDVEDVEPDEQETFDRIIEAMAGGGRITRERYGRSVRTSHAKAHGILKGELRVLEDLPPELRQGLFAELRTYPVVVRLSHVPGEFLDDRRVSTPRGMSLKIIGVEGEMLPGHQREVTQDWVLDTGKVFIAPTAKVFLAQITATEMAMPLPEGVKQAVSASSRAANAALNAVGLDSANLDFYGHPFNHPLAEAYYSQCPFRYGDYIAKLRVRPTMPRLHELRQAGFTPADEDGLRTAVVEYFRDNPAEYEVGIQLCTNLERMPVENANAEWPEDESPYWPVARLVLPPQEAFDAARRALDEDLLFCPSHSLSAHRPLGSIMRARLKAYEVRGNARRKENGRSAKEPRSIEEISI
ncbi:hypothetical protein ILT44_21770 [Microvirga sp. BT689]|uniref:catalase family protein n=1 Tax=Microvirga arvi TaxID=2778731 RepID=UPI001950BC41|nr:catalase family protein [Microvirga arvi]MBM6582838.1 hypothetical protein [Microvirga arvi]